MTTGQKLHEMRVAFETLQSHLAERPQGEMPPCDREAWFETLCQLIGAHQLALGRIQEIVYEYKAIGMGYLLAEAIREGADMIYEVNGHYAISSGHMWLPGCYESKEAAHYAFQFDDQTLQDLQDSVNPGGIISMSMLKAARKEQPCKSVSS